MAERGRGTGIVLERVDRPSHDGGAHVPSRQPWRDLHHGWPETPGITGRIAVERVAGLPWNPHLHVGHAKSICLNLGIAQESRAAAVEQASALRTVYRSTTA
jgi:hypothetical protein